MFYAFFIYSGMWGFGRLVIKRTTRCFIKFQASVCHAAIQDAQIQGQGSRGTDCYQE